MRLFSVPSGSVDRKTRAWLLTTPFDLAFDSPVAVVQSIVRVPGRRTTVTAAGQRTTVTAKGDRTGEV